MARERRRQHTGKSVKRGPVSAPERQRYVAQIGSDKAWRRPTEFTVRTIWDLLVPYLPKKLEDFMPKGKTRPTPDEYVRRVLVAKQSVVVALECAIGRAGRLERGGRRAMLTKNALFEALAELWSASYRCARREGTRNSYDLRRETLVDAQRELLLVGIRFDTLWQVLTRRWTTALRASARPVSKRSSPRLSGQLRVTLVTAAKDRGALRAIRCSQRDASPKTDGHADIASMSCRTPRCFGNSRRHLTLTVNTIAADRIRRCFLRLDELHRDAIDEFANGFARNNRTTRSISERSRRLSSRFSKMRGFDLMSRYSVTITKRSPATTQTAAVTSLQQALSGGTTASSSRSSRGGDASIAKPKRCREGRLNVRSGLNSHAIRPMAASGRSSIHYRRSP